MAYMVYQQYTNAIREAYTDHPAVRQHHESAKASREWLESLDIDPGVRATLVEQLATLETAFRDLLPKDSTT